MNYVRTIAVLFILVARINAQSLDLRLLDRINSRENPKRDLIFLRITQSAVPVSFSAPLLMFAAGYNVNDRAAINRSYYVGSSILLTSIITTSIKFGIQRERPFVENDFICRKCSVGKLSFPSGHTSTVFATATALSLAYPKWYVVGPSFLWASAVAYSRMYLGVHYPSDVLGGMVIGIGVSYIMWEVERKLNNL